MLTSRDPRWKRDDVAKRLLPIRLEMIEDAKVPEARLQQSICDQRPQIWGAMLTTMNTIVRLLQADPGDFVSNHRLADFHWFGRLAAEALGVSDDFQAAMALLNDTQLDLLAEGDAKLELFQAWFDTKPNEWEEILQAKKIFAELRPLHEGSERDFPFKNGASVGTWLGQHWEMIRHRLGVKVTKDRSTMTRSWRFSKTRCHGDSRDKSKINQIFPDHDTMTPSFGSKVSVDEMQPAAVARDHTSLFRDDELIKE
jgi:hypothetical protein